MTPSEVSRPDGSAGGPVIEQSSIRASRRSLPLWLVGAAYSVIAVTVTLLDRPLHYVADNRFESYESPWRVLARSMSTWDSSRGFGAPRDDVWIATTLPVAVLRSIGFSAELAERLFHAGLLVALALGVVVLVRDLRPSFRTESAVAGLTAMLNPFTISFLTPTNLFVMVAITPWLLCIAGRGLRRGHPWRHAAALALIVFVAGNGDTPGLAYSSLSVAVYLVGLVAIERSAPWRQALGWSIRAGALSAATAAWALVKTVHSSDLLNARLAATELPSTSAAAASWSESWRGLGNWLSYFVESGRLTKPHTESYFVNPVVIAATFAVPVTALAVLWISRWRGRLVVGSLMMVSVALMASGFPIPDRSPLGVGVLWAMDNFPAFTSLRNTYKAGAGLVIGMSVLAAVGVVAVCRAARHRSHTAGALVIAVCLAVGTGMAWPAVSGDLYHPDERADEVPDYWHEALEYLDDLPTGGRSLIIPAVSQAWYRWGYTGDDIFDALLSRDHATGTGWMLSTRPAHVALDALTLATQPPAYRAGIVGPMARRLGITEIVLRNDLDWERNSVPRPAAYLALRADPDLELVASFGAPGMGATTAPLDGSPEAAYERTLPAVEVYRIRDSPGSMRVSDPRNTVIVAGDATGWAPLFTAGLAEPERALAASAAMDDEALLDALQADAPIAVTDGQRRRVLTLLRHEPQLSPTLSDGQMLDRPAWATFGSTPGADSTAWFRDALHIEGSAIRLGGNRNDRRPALAFDGNPSTMWAVPSSGLAGPTAFVKVYLRRTESIGRIRVQTTLAPSGRPTVRTVNVWFSNGSTHLMRIDDSGVGDLSIPPISTESVRLSLGELTSFGREVGLVDVAIDDLDLREYVMAPTDLDRRGEATIDAIQRAHTAYLFRRTARSVSASPPALVSSAFNEEVTLSRRVANSTADTYRLSGTIVLTAATNDAMFSRATGSSLTAWSSRDPGFLTDRHTFNVVDGDVSSTWSGPARVGAAVTVRFPTQQIRVVRVAIPDDQSTSRITRVALHFGTDEIEAIPQARRCTTTGVCTRTASFRLPSGTEVNEVVVRVAALDRTLAIDPDLIRIAEIQIGEGEPLRLDLSASLSAQCVDLGLRLDTAHSGTTPLVRLSGTMADLIGGRPIAFTGCGDITLDVGELLLSSTPGSPIDEVHLVSVGWPVATTDRGSPAVSIEWQRESSDRWDGSVSGTGLVELVTGTSFDRGWVLVADGQRVQAVERDALSSVTFLARDGIPVSLVYEPAAVQRLARLVTLLTVLACLSIVAMSILRRPQIAAAAQTPELLSIDSPRDQYRPTMIAIVTVAAGVLLAGWIGLMVSVAVAAFALTLPRQTSLLGAAPIGLMLLAAVQTVVAADVVSILYPRERWAPSALARLATVFAVPVLLFAVSAERRRDISTLTQPRVGNRLLSWSRIARRHWLALAAAAVGGLAAWRASSGVPGPLVRSVLNAGSYSTIDAHGPLAIDIAPLAVVITAFSPVDPTWWRVAAGSAVAAASGLATRRWCRHRWGIPAASAATAVWIGVAGPSMPTLMAAAFAMAALAVVRTTRGDGRAAIVGVLTGAAVLAVSSTIVLLLPIVALQRRARSIVVTVLVAGLTSAAWLGVVVRAASLDDLSRLARDVQWLVPLGIGAVAAIGSAVVRRRTPS